MPMGICYRKDCGAEFEFRQGHAVVCPVCTCTSAEHSAAARWLAKHGVEDRKPVLPPLQGGYCNLHMRSHPGCCPDCVRQAEPTPDPTPAPASEGDSAQAFKSDGGKVRFDLLDDGCPNALLMIAKVLTWAVEVKGYHPHSWKEVPEASRRYRAALSRHRNAIARGEVLDPESGYPHWAHVACCTIFLLELENFNE